MSKTIYSPTGHKFIVDGEIQDGNIVTITVEPLTGYELVEWFDGDTNYTRELQISCGKIYQTKFKLIEDCNKNEIYSDLNDILGEENGQYETTEDISCEQIMNELTKIIG